MGISNSAALAVVAMAAATAIALAARWSWLADLATHFALQWTLGAALTLTILLFARRWKWSAAAGVVLAVNGAVVAPLFWPTGVTISPDASTYQVLSANLHVGNRDLQPFVAFVKNRQPDVFFVMEVDDAALAQFEPLHAPYPHRILAPRSDAFGCAMYSRRPITADRIEYLTEQRLPTLVATIDFDGREVLVVGTHPPPPISSGFSQYRDEQLLAAADLVAETPGAVILMGDLNTSSWSPSFQDLLARSGLRDSRQGFGVQPSWPELPWPCRIPIDHVLVSPEVRIVSRELGPSVGSDHLPVLATFALTARR